MNKRNLLIESATALKNSIIYSISLSVVLPILLWVWKPDFKVPLWVCMIILTILLLMLSLLATSIYILIDMFNKEKNKKVTLPKIVSVKDNLLILAQSSLFEYNILVTIFIIDEDESETFLGIGQVLNIQGNGLIQIEIKSWNNEYERISQQLKQNNKSMISKVHVKPVISRERLEEFGGGL